MTCDRSHRTPVESRHGRQSESERETNYPPTAETGRPWYNSRKHPPSFMSPPGTARHVTGPIHRPSGQPKLLTARAKKTWFYLYLGYVRYLWRPTWVLIRTWDYDQSSYHNAPAMFRVKVVICDFPEGLLGPQYFSTAVLRLAADSVHLFVSK